MNVIKKIEDKNIRVKNMLFELNFTQALFFTKYKFLKYLWE